MPYLSIVINCDTREEKNEQTGLLGGVANFDFLTDGIFNKVKFFDGFDKEIIIFIDEHLQVLEKTLEYLRSIVDTLVIRKHTHEEKFNDYNYLSALSLARGEYVVHFDQDVSAFTSNQETVQEMIDLLEIYDYVSYPSHWSPFPTHDPNYDYYWCSTRFFMCKRDTLDFTEIKKCLQDMDYLYSKYPASVRNPWLEHILALISKYTGKGIFYPPINYDKLSIFTWESYETYTLRRLNELPYWEIKKWIIDKGGIFYPNNLKV